MLYKAFCGETRRKNICSKTPVQGEGISHSSSCSMNRMHALRNVLHQKSHHIKYFCETYSHYENWQLKALLAESNSKVVLLLLQKE